MTWKHVAIVAMGLGVAAFGAWVTMMAPAGIGGPMVIALGSSVVTGALGHAGQGLTIGRGPSSSSAVPATYIPSSGSIPNDVR